MTTLVALLRGVNLGRRTVRSAELKKCFEGLGFAHVRTLLASGNILFEARSRAPLRSQIEERLHQQFGFEIGTILRSQEELQRLVRSDPFAGQEEDENTKRYVTFLEPREGKKLPMPFEGEGDFRVVRANAGEICSLAFRSPEGRHGLGMERIGKHFGRRVLWTTRNWNTVLKAAG